MKIEFRFNGARQAILIPETARDRTLLQLCLGERPELRIVPSNTDQVIIEARDSAPANEVEKQEGE